MSDKAMLSVERQVIEDILADAREPGHHYMAARKVLRALLDKPPCLKCGDSGEADSGGVHPWGEGINIPCDCTQVETLALQHMAVSEGGVLRWMSGRKMQDCELYARPDGTAIRSKLFAMSITEGTTSDKYKAELYDEVWQKARDMGFANVTDALAELEKTRPVKIQSITVRTLKV